jgi:hypothetical protein
MGKLLEIANKGKKYFKNHQKLDHLHNRKSEKIQKKKRWTIVTHEIF